jgi:hypothetical protein
LSEGFGCCGEHCGWPSFLRVVDGDPMVSHFAPHFIACGGVAAAR